MQYPLWVEQAAHVVIIIVCVVIALTGYVTGCGDFGFALLGSQGRKLESNYFLWSSQNTALWS